MNAQSIRDEATVRRVHHPGMTRAWFLDAVNRALAANMLVFEGPRRNIVIIPSSRGDGLEYTVSRQWCTCSGHYYTGRCLHRALAIAWIDLLDLEPMTRFHSAGRPYLEEEVPSNVVSIEGRAGGSRTGIEQKGKSHVG